MKRYKIEYGFLIDTETNEILGYPYNEYVDADIAQELYDALKWSMKYFDQVIAETGYQSEGERIAHRNCKEALEKADKD